MPRENGSGGNRSASERAAARARREERRAKQREQNGARARLMHIARLEHERRALPDARDDTAAVGLTRARESLIAHVGCSGWYYWHWGGAFYPNDIPRASWFRHYANAFTTVELNAPFYSWPT